MLFTVGSVRRRRLTAKMEARVAWITDGPLAHPLLCCGYGMVNAFDRRWSRGESEAVSLSNDRVARNVSQAISDLACAQTFFPQIF